MNYGEILKAQLATKLTSLVEDIDDGSRVPLVLTVKELKNFSSVTPFKFLLNYAIRSYVDDITLMADNEYIYIEVDYEYGDLKQISLCSLPDKSEDWYFDLNYLSTKTEKYTTVSLKLEELIALSKLLHG